MSIPPLHPSGTVGTRDPEPPAGSLLPNLGDHVFRTACQAAALLVIVLAGLLFLVLVWKAWEAITTIGLHFFTGTVWDPEPSHRIFGALPFVYGTVMSSLIAMLIAVPLGIGTAAF